MILKLDLHSFGWDKWLFLASIWFQNQNKGYPRKHITFSLQEHEDYKSMQKLTTVHPNTHQYRPVSKEEVQCAKTKILTKLGLVVTHNPCQKHPPNLLISNPIKRKEDCHSCGDHGRALRPGNDGTGCILEKRKKMRQCLW